MYVAHTRSVYLSMWYCLLPPLMVNEHSVVIIIPGIERKLLYFFIFESEICYQNRVTLDFTPLTPSFRPVPLSCLLTLVLISPLDTL